MGMTRIINKKLNVDVKSSENPRNNNTGILPTSITESFSSYLNRIGNPKNAYLSFFPMGPYTDTTFHYSTLYQPSIGMIFYPMILSISPDKDCSVAFKISTGISGPSNAPTDLYFFRYIKAKENYELKLDEGTLRLFADNGGKISVGVAAEGASVGTPITTNIHASVYGIEVTPDV